jgi:hypothetical protein
MKEIINENPYEKVNKEKTKLELATLALQGSHCHLQKLPESSPMGSISPNFKAYNSSSDTVLEGESNERICDLPPIEQKIAKKHLINMSTQEVIVKIEDTFQDLDLTTRFQIAISPRPHQNNISDSNLSPPRRRLSSKSSLSLKNMYLAPPALGDHGYHYKLQQINSESNFTQKVPISPVPFNSPACRAFFSNDTSLSRECKPLFPPATLHALSLVRNHPFFQSYQIPNNIMFSSIPDLEFNHNPQSRSRFSSKLAQTSKFKLKRRPARSIGPVMVFQQSRFFLERIISSSSNLRVSGHIDEFDETINWLKHKLSFIANDETVNNIVNDTDQSASQLVNYNKPITNLLESLDIPYVQNGQDLNFDSDNEESESPPYFGSKDSNELLSKCVRVEPMESRSNLNGTVCFFPNSDSTAHVSYDIDASVEILSNHKTSECYKQEEPLGAINNNGEKNAGIISKNLQQSHQSLFFQADEGKDEIHDPSLLSAIEENNIESLTPTSMEANPSPATDMLNVVLRREFPLAFDLEGSVNLVNSLAVDADCEMMTTCVPVSHTHVNFSERNHSNIHLSNDLRKQIADQNRYQYMPTKSIKQNIDEAGLLNTSTIDLHPRLKRRRIFRVGLSKRAKVKPLHPNLYKKAA